MSGRKPPRPLTPPKRPVTPPQRPVVPRPASGRPEAPAVPDEPKGPPPRTPPPTTPPPTSSPGGGRPAAPTVPSQRTAPPRLPVAAPPEAPPRRVRSPAIIAAVALLVAAAVLAVVVVRGGDDPVGPGARGPEGVPPVPADLAPRNALVHARITASGDVVVQQWIRSASTLFGIGLSRPQRAGAAAGVRVRGVQVFANGGQALGPKRLEKDREYYPFAAGTNDVFVRYHLEGAVERSGSVAGRALVTVTALDVDVTPRLVATTYAVAGGDVLALACASDHPGALPAPCGAPAGRGWRVERAGAHRNDMVTAQVDLP